MFYRIRSRANKIGIPAGEIAQIQIPKAAQPPSVTFIGYDDYSFFEKVDQQIDMATELRNGQIHWIQIEGEPTVSMMKTVGEKLGLHPLVLEDVMTTQQRPKVDDYEDYLFIVMRLLDYDEKSGEIFDEQVSLILGQDYLISFEQRSFGVFQLVKERLRSGRGLVRRQKADFLAYALIDAIVDHYFVLLEQVGSRIDRLEESQLESTPQSLSAIHHIRREIVLLRKSLWPLREVISRLQRDDTSPLISETTKFYLKDVYDHAIEVIDTIDAFRDLSRGLLEANLSKISFRMNEIIKLLTIVSTIFVPLTFITSLYGMNFERMPELTWRYGYFFAWGVMIAIVVFMIRFFRKKKWI